jgi:hypothetical protein
VVASVRDRLLILGSSLLPLTVWWFVLLPGNFTIDSIDVVNQIRSGTWNDWHTNAYTLFAWSTSLGGRVWSFITLSQVLLMALGIGSLGWALNGSRTSIKTAAVASAIFSSLPQVGSFTVTMWKDVPSTAGALMLAAALIEWKSSTSHSKIPISFAVIGAVLLASFRWNGPVALGVLSIVLIVLHRKESVRLVLGVMLAAFIALTSLFLPQRINLAESTTWFNFEVRELHDIAYVFQSRPSIFREDDLRLLSSVMPLPEWAVGGSSCEGVEVLQYKSFARNAPSSFDTALERRAEIRQLWRKVVFRAPLQVATVRICRAGGVLSPVFFGQQPTLGLWHNDATDQELVRAKYFPAAESFLANVVRATSQSEATKTVFLNAMLWTIIALALNFLGRSTSAGIWAVVAVGSSIMISVALGANAHDARYVAGALLATQYFSLFSIVDRLQSWRGSRVTERG